MPIPPVPSQFPQLEGLTDGQLERLLTDDVAFESLAAGLPSVETLTELRKTLDDGIVEAAQSNFEREEEMNNLFFEVGGLQQRLKEGVARFDGRRLEVYGEVKSDDKESDRRLVEQVNAARDKLDMEAESLAQEFVDGDKDVSGFIKDFKMLKQQAHERGGKVERMRELLR